MYYAKGNEVWVKSAYADQDEFFLTVHETEPVRSGVITLERQAEMIADFLNKAVKVN